MFSSRSWSGQGVRNRPYSPCVDGLLLSGVCGDSEPPADICSYVCSMSGVEVLPPGPPGASVLGGSYCFPTPPGFCPGRRVGRNTTQRPRAASQICALLSHSLLTPRACLGNPALLIACGLLGQLQGGTGRGHISSICFISRATSSVQAPLTGQW